MLDTMYNRMEMMKIELEITDGITSRTKTFKEGTTIERAEEVMEQM